MEKDCILKLNKLCTVLDDKYLINSGGCAIVALNIAAELQMRNIPYAICVFYRGNYKKSSGKISPNGKYINLLSWAHIALEVKGEIINPIHRAYHHLRIKTSDNIKWLYEFIITNEFNPMYKRDNNFRVGKEINKFFKQNL